MRERERDGGLGKGVPERDCWGSAKGSTIIFASHDRFGNSLSPSSISHTLRITKQKTNSRVLALLAQTQKPRSMLFLGSKIFRFFFFFHEVGLFQQFGSDSVLFQIFTIFFSSSFFKFQKRFNVWKTIVVFSKCSSFWGI